MLGYLSKGQYTFTYSHSILIIIPLRSHSTPPYSHCTLKNFEVDEVLLFPLAYNPFQKISVDSIKLPIRGDIACTNWLLLFSFAKNIAWFRCQIPYWTIFKTFYYQLRCAIGKFVWKMFRNNWYYDSRIIFKQNNSSLTSDKNNDNKE